MRVSGLALNNWMPFGGTASIEPDAEVYAVVAEHAHDAGRSNWMGKSSLLAAVRFALFGTHPKRTEDEWITNGAPAGGVMLTLSDGSYIERARQRGKSTQLQFTLPDGAKLAQSDAQERIVEHIGLTEDDFVNTCYFEQKQMARLVTALPSERMSIVAAWLNLEPLQRCEENVRKRLSVLAKEDADLTAKLNALDSQVSDTLEQLEVDSTEALDRTIALLEKEADQARAEADKVQAERDRLAEWRLDAERAEEYEQVVEEGKALKAELEAGDVEELKVDASRMLETCNKAKADYEQHEQKVQRLVVLSRGEFDGACPVMEGFDCPAKDTINAKAEENAKALATAKGYLEQSSSAFDEARKGARELAEQIEAYAEKEDELNALREKAVDLLPSHKRIEEDGEPPEDVDTEPTRRAANEAELKLRTYLHAKEAIEKAHTRRTEHEDRRTEIAGDLAVLREALVIFGRNGAQKTAAELALADIEQGANGLLRDAAIDLTIEVRWGREGKGLATHCDACGSPFPKSARVKDCTHCGEKRGKKTIDRLDIELSDRSGAAEDLAGVAFQLAAGAWLRNARSTPWSAAFIDEPFGALDETNRRALASHLTAMLRGRYGFEQAFVVAHDRGIMDAMPGRIVVQGQPGGGSTVKVG